MYLIKISSFDNINIFKLFFLKLLYRGIKNFHIDFYNSNIFDNEVILFLKRYKNSINIKVKNIPFCINNGVFDIDDNDYKYKFSSKCLKCSYSISCKGNHNTKNKINILNNKNVDIHRNKILNGIKHTYIFLNNIGFKYKDIYISGNKYILYYYLFEGYDMFFNSLSNSYFYKSEHNRLSISLDNINLCDDLFINRGKNLLFKDKYLLDKYIELMASLDLDITFYGNNNSEGNLKKEYKNVIFDGMNFNFYINSNLNFNTFFNYKKNNFISYKDDISNNIINGIFIGKKIINCKKREKIILEVVNITNNDYNKLPEKFVLVGNDTTPKYLKEIIKADCLLLQRNTEISHGAIMSRELKKDCIYGIEGIPYNVNSGDFLEINFDTLQIKIIYKKYD